MKDTILFGLVLLVIVAISAAVAFVIWLARGGSERRLRKRLREVERDTRQVEPMTPVEGARMR